MTLGRETRSNSDLELIGILSKQDVCKVDCDTLFPDTLAYIFESNGHQVVMSADNRIHQSLLADYNYVSNSLHTTNNIIENIISVGLANYITNEIIDYENRKDSILSELQMKLNDMVLKINTKQTRIEAPKDYDLNEEFHINEYPIDNWHFITHISPMIYVEWGQDSPYNDSIANILNCGTVLTGCVPVAVAQLMSYWEHPTSLENWYIDWNSLKSRISISDWCSSTLKQEVAKLMKEICFGCQTQFDCDGSSTATTSTKAWLRSRGYTVEDEFSYNSSSVVSSILNSRPVLILGWNNNYEGHAWDIDGYILEGRTYQRDLYVFDRDLNHWVLIESGTYLKRASYFHYNWGWKGLYNGWFSVGCFDYTEEATMNTRSSSPDSFSNDVKIITNIRPNNE